MNARNKKDRNTAETLSPEQKDLLAKTRSVDRLNFDRFEASIRDLEGDAGHIAETRKASFVEDVLRALDEENIGKSELARRLGKTRQQLSFMLNEEKLNNFTIETMAEIAAALGRHLLVRMISPDEPVTFHGAGVRNDNQIRQPKPLGRKTLAKNKSSRSQKSSREERDTPRANLAL